MIFALTVETLVTMLTVDCRDNVDNGISDNLYNDNDDNVDKDNGDNVDKDNGDNIDYAIQRQNCETHLHSKLWNANASIPMLK